MIAVRFPVPLTNPITGLAGICLALSLLLSSCQDPTAEVTVISDSDESSAPLPEVVNQPSAQGQGKDWRLTAWTQNSQMISLVPDVEVFLRLEEAQISGSGGCNQYSAAYRVEGDRMIIEPLRSTRRACDGPVMEQETKFFTALQSAHHVTRGSDDSLTVAYGEASTAGLLFLSP